MKRKNLFLSLVVFIVLAIMSQTAAFAWEPYYEDVYAEQNAVKVSKTKNNEGQTVYTAYNSYGNVILDLRARNGNIWNETTKVLLISTNKGPDYVGISENLDVYGINQVDRPMKYRKGFQSGEVPYILPDVQATSIKLDNNGIIVGFNTYNGVYNIENDYNYDDDYNYNDEYNYDYPKVVQKGNEYYYYYNSGRYVTYKYAPESNKLTLDGASLLSISEIAFAPGYLFAVTSSNKVFQIPIGTLEREETFDEYFYEWIYSDNTSWVKGYRGKYYSYYFETDNYNNDYDYGYNDDYGYGYDESYYPYIQQNGTQYSYFTTSNFSYDFNLSSSGKLTYNSTVIDTDVEQVEFARGYLVYVAYDEWEGNSVCFRVKLGNTTKSKVCSNFYQFEYDYNGFVTEAKDERNRTYDL